MPARDTQQPYAERRPVSSQASQYTAHEDAEMASYCSSLPSVLRWRLCCFRRGWRQKHWRKSTFYIRVTKTRQAQDLKVFLFFLGAGKKKIRKSVPPSSSLWARGQAKGRKEGERRGGGGMKRGGRELGKAGESRRDLWGLQGCTKKMQNNLTLSCSVDSKSNSSLILLSHSFDFSL